MYYSKLLLYCIFLLFLSGYILHTAPMRQPFRNEHCQLNDAELKDTFMNIVFVKVGRVVILGLSVVHLIFEVKWFYLKDISIFSHLTLLSCVSCSKWIFPYQFLLLPIQICLS